VAIEKEERAQGLGLGRGSDLLPDGQVREEAVDLGLPHLIGVAFAVEEDETRDPADVSLFGP
jgi:hypothetical protein